MFSRLYTQILNQYPYVENCQCFNHSYIDSGIFGITLSLVPQAAGVGVQMIGNELSKLLTKENGMTMNEVERAKNN